MPAVALPEGRMITVSHDTTICWADSDGCFNYILQSDQLLKATGKKLRAGGTYFHTPFDVTKEPDGDALLRQLLMQERRSFAALLTWDNILHLTSYILLLAILWLAGLWLYQRLWHRRRIRD